MRRAAQANWSRLPNHNPPHFYTAWTRSGHGGTAYAWCYVLDIDPAAVHNPCAQGIAR